MDHYFFGEGGGGGGGWVNLDENFSKANNSVLCKQSFFGQMHLSADNFFFSCVQIVYLGYPKIPVSIYINKPWACIIQLRISGGPINGVGEGVGSVLMTETFCPDVVDCLLTGYKK